jgi:hypothetical protein
MVRCNMGGNLAPCIVTPRGLFSADDTKPVCDNWYCQRGHFRHLYGGADGALRLLPIAMLREQRHGPIGEGGAIAQEWLQLGPIEMALFQGAADDAGAIAVKVAIISFTVNRAAEPVLPTGVLGRLPQARRDAPGPGRSGPEARGGGRSGDAGGE